MCYLLLIRLTTCVIFYLLDNMSMVILSLIYWIISINIQGIFDSLDRARNMLHPFGILLVSFWFTKQDQAQSYTDYAYVNILVYVLISLCPY